MFNYRVDAVKVKEVDGLHSIIPYVLPKRTEAEVSITEHFDVTKLNEYLRQKNETEGINLKLFHAICTAVAKTIYLRPLLNQFIAGRFFWKRNDITLSFVVKRVFEDSSEESLMTLKVTPDMTIESVSKMILGEVSQLRENKSNDLDKAMQLVGKMPRFMLEILFWGIRRMEYHGVMPRSLMKGDPNYSTVLLSNLGSIGAGAPYHHLNNYGTCSMMITIGTMYSEIQMADGQMQPRDMVDCSITLDERIADGFYFARSLKLIHFLFDNPEYLSRPVNEPLPVNIDSK